ncbi:MAG: ADP-glyceromanno-heptose 6-epimerase [Bdellovibrionaceae bacterium]|nr:ADP-glyceromanno-heptose 6-epimerase [Pseudobdellovibrionaceae bacterium]NUM59280.1 ADP-glyceromanno-heptose 6-epimerase [Pseudobdellovibrionaceae bacterium]
MINSDLKNSTVIVTGANGFIGSVIIWQLNKIGFTQIVAVDSISLEKRNLLKHLKFAKFLLKDQLIKELQLEAKDRSEVLKKVSWIIHMGACSSTTETNWEFLLENNTHYTQKLYEWAQKNHSGFIYASSAATYGAGENGFDDNFDSEKLKPLNLYGESKVLFDRWLMKQVALPEKVYGLKFFNVFGPMEYHKESMASVVYKSFHLIKQTSQVQLFKSHKPEYKDGEQLRDFVYVKDVSRWILELMNKKPRSGIYNMGFGKARTWLDLATSVFRSMNKTANIQWIEIPDNIKNQYQYFTEAKMGKLFQQNLSSPEWPLEKAIEDYVKNYLEKGDAFLKAD